MKKSVLFMKNKYSLGGLCCIVFLIVIPRLGLTQEFYVGAFSIPPSPESSSLIRSVNVPVDKYTGAANIQIPLYTIKTQDMQIPIVLTYQSSGIKVQDVATWVGLGWNLSVGGRITRVVRHLPDETGYSSQENGHWSQIQNLNGWNKSNFESRLKNMDTEPDVFYFEIPGRSGMFVVDGNGVAHTIPYQKIKIEWGGYTFTITDEKGVKYTFKTRETTESTVKDGAVTKTVSFTSSWYLDEIATVAGRKINYSYTKGNDYEFYNYNKRYVLKFHDIGGRKVEIDQQQEQNTLVKIKEPKYLNRISWGAGSLVFESEEGRPDVGGARKLTSIKFAVDGNIYMKSMLLSYSAFPGTASNAHTALRLDKLEEIAYTGEKRLLNKFQYNVNSLYKRNSSMYDHWGYTNVTGGVLTGHPRFACGVQNTSTGGVHFGYLDGESREVDTVYNQFGMLKRIYYTENSFKEFEFESNRVLINGYDRFQGGLRIKKIKEYENASAKPLVTSYYYTTSYGQPSGKAFMNDPYYLYPIYYSYEEMKILGVTQSYTAYYYVAFDQPILSPFDLNGTSVGYSEVKEVCPNGSWNVYKFFTSSEVPDEVHACYNVYSGNSLGTALFTPNSSKFWARGLLKEMISYNAQGNETYKQEFSYKTDLRAREEILAYIPYYYGEGMKIGDADLRIPMIGVYKWISQPIVTSSIKESGTEILSKITTYTYDPNYLVPKEITLTDAMNTVYRRTLTYPFNYTVANAEEANVNAYALKIMNQKNMINYPIETIQYKDNKITGGTINEYKCIVRETPVLDKIKDLKLTEPVVSLNRYYAGVDEDPKYKISRYFDSYDKIGRLTQYHDQDGDTISYIYGGGDQPVAEVIGASYSEESRKSEVVFQNFEHYSKCDLTRAKSGRSAKQGPHSELLGTLKPGVYKLSYWKSINGGKTWNKVETPLIVDAYNPAFDIIVGDKSCYIDDIIIAPEKARIKSCCYWWGFGKVSETDHNGNTTYYDYDSFGRLIAIYDNERNLITRYMYHDATAY